MRPNFKERLEKHSQRLISEHESYAKWVHDENARRMRRSIRTVERVPLQIPPAWSADPGFNPYLVRSRRAGIAHSVTKALKSGSYDPRPPFTFSVPKTGGGERQVSTFQIADEIISLQVYRSLLTKNFPLLSSRAYAYRYDRGPHDAISYISSEFTRTKRIFVAEYDFQDFFGSISHEYLFERLKESNMKVTPLEKHIIERFLQAPILESGAYSATASSEPRTAGIPQGTSLSLFLANLAASELDRSLELLGVGFVRFADDTLIWSSSYEQICQAVTALYEASALIGSAIHEDKSKGIRLLTSVPSRPAEMTTTEHVNFLGHRLDLQTIRMKDSSLDKIKKRITELVYTNLLLEPSKGSQCSDRLTETNVDKDYVTLIFQLRRYLYGSLTESDLRRFRNGSIPKMKFDGVMSYFPLVNNSKELTQLDGWIATTIWLAMQKRARLLKAAHLGVPDPHGLSKEELITFKAQSPKATGGSTDLRIPSVRRISDVISLAVTTHGLQVVSSNGPLYSYEG